jgi:predicted ATPase
MAHVCAHPPDVRDLVGFGIPRCRSRAGALPVADCRNALPRPKALFVLNEPESSLHPELLEPLVGLVHTAAQETQVIVVAHTETLVDHLERVGDPTGASPVLELVKEDGETRINGQRSIDEPSWRWPSR